MMLLLSSNADSATCLPSGEMPNDSVMKSGENPASDRRLGEVSRPGTKSWVKTPDSPASFMANKRNTLAVGHPAGPPAPGYVRQPVRYHDFEGNGPTGLDFDRSNIISKLYRISEPVEGVAAIRRNLRLTVVARCKQRCLLAVCPDFPDARLSTRGVNNPGGVIVGFSATLQY
jgi:hypothetical protein